MRPTPQLAAAPASVGLLFGVVLALWPAGIVLAHDGAPPEPHDLWQSWSLGPLVLSGLVVAGGLYLRGVRALWARAGTGRGIRRWQAAAYAGGLITLVVALVSPLDAVSAALLSAHMVQHLLLIVVAVPLLVLGTPAVAMLWSLPAPRRRALGRWWHGARGTRAAWRVVSAPLPAWLLHTATLWAWHAPPLYEAALGSGLVHVAEHLAFFGTGLLWWWTVLAPGPGGRAGYGLGVVAIFGMALQSGILGALMTFAPTPWYATYLDRTAPWGLTPHQDQQLAGLLMWIPAGTVYLFAALGLLAQWLRVPEPERGEVPVSVPSLRSRR